MTRFGRSSKAVHLAVCCLLGAALAASQQRRSSPGSTFLAIPAQGGFKAVEARRPFISSATGALAQPSSFGLVASFCAAIGAGIISSLVTRRISPINDSKYVERVKVPRIPELPIMWHDKNLGYRIRGKPGWRGTPHTWTEPMRWCRRFTTRIYNRALINGTCALPRLAVFRSLHHIYVNVVDDSIGHGVIVACSSTRQQKNLIALREMQGCEKGKENTWNEQAAELIGKDIATKLQEKKIYNVVFDRGGFRYQGRVKALKEAASSAGLMIDMKRPNGKGAAQLARKM